MHARPGLCILAAAVLLLNGQGLPAASAAIGLEVSSPAFPPDGAIPVLFSCKGEDVNPPLKIQGIPPATRSLVLIFDDPDAPGGLFTHWIVWNIPPSTSGIAQKSVPAGGIEGTNDFGRKGYGGPCPPSGTHRYVFHVLALKEKLALGAGAKRGALEKAIAGRVLARGELTGRFTR
jgi:Raf kinase inhibitor-like YbhB/YbcL family protein